MNNEERAMQTSPHNPDYRIVRGGKPGKYFFYRPAEVLVLGSNEEAVEEVLGKRHWDENIAVNDRTEQRQAIREDGVNGEPFGVMLFRFGTSANGEARTVDDAIRLLSEKGIVAGYNYISSRSPMRSHAVSYAEPTELPSRTVRSTSSASMDVSPTLVAVLDTGRPVYDDAFREYYRNRFAIAAVGQVTPTAASASASSDPFAAIDAMFVDRSLPQASEQAGPGSVPTPVHDRDTMVTPFGKLSHPHAGHGVFVSSIIARHAPGVRILAEATMHRDSIADLHEILVDLADAIEEPYNCKLLNMSLGFPTEADKCPPILEHAMSRLLAKAVLLVASAGNDGSNRKMWPAAHEDVIAVAATDEHGTPTDWSNHGDWVNACAFGNDVDSDYVFGAWDFPDGTAKQFRGAARWSGTSFAAPLVTAYIANAMKPGDKALDAWTRVRDAGTTQDDHGDGIPVVYGVRIVPQTE